MVYFSVASFDRCGIPPPRVFGQKAITSARVEGDEIVFALADASESRLPVDGKNRCISRGHPEPEEIVVERPHMVRHQRKKIDGGGWHEVEKVGVCMTLTNPGAKVRNEQWRKDEEKRRRDEASRQHAEAVSVYLSKQLQLAGNGRVVSISQDGGAALVITFENGHKLFVDSDADGRGDGYYASVVVEGADTYTHEWEMGDKGMELIDHN